MIPFTFVLGSPVNRHIISVSPVIVGSAPLTVPKVTLWEHSLMWWHWNVCPWTSLDIRWVVVLCWLLVVLAIADLQYCWNANSVGPSSLPLNFESFASEANSGYFSAASSQECSPTSLLNASFNFTILFNRLHSWLSSPSIKSPVATCCSIVWTVVLSKFLSSLKFDPLQSGLECW